MLVNFNNFKLDKPLQGHRGDSMPCPFRGEVEAVAPPLCLQVEGLVNPLTPNFRPAVRFFFWPPAPAHFWRSSQGVCSLK